MQTSPNPRVINQRFVVIKGQQAFVYEGKKRLAAFEANDGAEISAEDIEKIRVQPYTPTLELA